MKLIVGLGNPEKQYDATRHNVGFDTLDLLKPKKYEWNTQEKDFHFLYTAKTNTWLVKPVTGMNVCGPVIKRICKAYKIRTADVVVVYDDMDFEPGQIKVKVGGGDGKHNGVKSLIQHIGPEFTRIRVGIGKPKTKEHGISFVLEPFTKPQRTKIDSAIEEAVGAANIIVREGAQSAMSFFNRRDK